MQLKNENDIHWFENDNWYLPLIFKKLRETNPTRIKGIKIFQENLKHRTFLVQIPVKRISNFNGE